MQISLIEKLLAQIPNKYALDKAVLLLAEIPLSDLQRFCQAHKQQAHHICMQFANHLEHIFLSGHICEVDYMLVFPLLRFAAPPLDSRFEVFLENLEALLFGTSSNEIENIFFIQICSVCKMFAFGAEQGMEFFISKVCQLDMSVVQSENIASFIVEYFVKLGVDFEFFLGCMQRFLPQTLEFSKFRRRSVFNWQLHCFWNVEGYFNHTKWLALYPVWRDIFYGILSRVQENLNSKNFDSAQSLLDEALYVQFFIYHICGNSFHTQDQWRMFCEEIDKVASKVYAQFRPYMQEFLTPHTKEHTPSKLHTIGILKDRIVENSPFKVEYSLFKNLLTDEEFCKRFRLKIYNMGLLEKSPDEEKLVRELESLGVEVCQYALQENTKGFYNSHLTKALLLLKEMQNDNIVALFSPNNGYGISDFLLSIKACDKQIYYSHGNFVYDIPNISIRATHICNASTKVWHEGFEFSGIPIKMDMRFYNPVLHTNDLHAIKVLKTKYSKKCLGTIGRLVKLDSKEYMQAIVRIMQQNPECVYLACGGGNKNSVRERIKEAFYDEMGHESCSNQLESLLERFYFEGYVDSVVYGHVIDLWLDSFPLEQGESRIEYVAKGGIALVLSQESFKERMQRIENLVNTHTRILEEFLQIHPHKASNLDHIKEILQDCSLVSFSQEEYVHKANSLLALDSLENLRSQSMLTREILDFLREKQCVNSFLRIITR
ncbi:MAG: hypothetical protein MSA68_06325 [Helicobacter sp.]|nr:hypothetical protein [Helicobacter sp.]